MKLTKWFWGIFFLLAGVAVIVNQLGYIGSINIFTLVVTILLIPIIIKSITHRNFGGILFPLAFIGILYKDELGITNLTPCPILLTALFLSIGLTIIFEKHNDYKKYCKIHGKDFDEVINVDDDSVFEVKVNFGSSIKYVNSSDFQRGIFNCSFSGVELYIPKEWEVVNNVSASLGGIEEKNLSHSKNGPKVILKGNISFAGVEIIYI